ncbi:MAG: fluoride efflux transporter CrcB [Bacteroidetes bacterium]|nr:fluoride efflux transporter CrcB [Bacteroidota bacterium]
MLKIIFLMAGGALGSLFRYGVSGLTHKYISGFFPWGTLMVNATGALFIGFLWGLFEQKGLSPNIRMFLFVGVLGGYTTFSTYALESMNLFRSGDFKMAIMNLLANNFLSILFVFGGYFLIRLLIINLK